MATVARIGSAKSPYWNRSAPYGRNLMNDIVRRQMRDIGIALLAAVWWRVSLELTPRLQVDSVRNNQRDTNET